VDYIIVNGALPDYIIQVVKGALLAGHSNFSPTPDSRRKEFVKPSLLSPSHLILLPSPLSGLPLKHFSEYFCSQKLSNIFFYHMILKTKRCFQLKSSGMIG
jgi:hypothetical protein